MDSAPKGKSAFGDPIRVDFPPHRTMPAAFINESICHENTKTRNRL
jgi:hypothetical protein